MMYNPARIPEGTPVLKFYKDLTKHKAFRYASGEGIDENILLLYIMCMYDKNSPYRKKYPDALKRKVEVARDVGFAQGDDGRFDPPVEDFLKGRNKAVNLKIVEYVRMHRSFKYAYMVSIETSYYRIMADIMEGSTKQLVEARNIQAELEETLTEIFTQDNNPYLVDDFLRYMEEERLELRPEDIALKIQNGTPFEKVAKK